MGNNENEIDNKEIYDSIGARITRLLSSFRDDGLTNLDIYHKIYGNREITEAAKKNKIADLCGGRKINTNDLICISQTFGISLDWLVFGKEVSPAQEASEKETAENKKRFQKSQLRTKEDEYNYTLERREESHKKQSAFIKRLLDTDHPVLQACSSFLNLLTYAEISIIGDYDIDNADIPQSLTLKITPKRYCMCGIFDKKNSKFFIERPFLEWDATEKEKERFETYSKMLFWDFRATLIQRAIAMSLDSKEKHYFDAAKILESMIAYMFYKGYHEYNGMLGLNDYKRITHSSIYEALEKYKEIHGYLSLVNEFGWFKGDCDHSLTDHFSFVYTDSAVCIRSCELEKAPVDLRDNIWIF